MSVIKIFGGEKKTINFIIAFVLALATVIPSVVGVVPDGWDVVKILQAFLPNISVMIIIVVLLILFAGLLGLESEFFVKRRFFVFSLLFLIVINLVVRYAFPEIFDFFLTFSVLAGILSVILASKNPITQYLPLTFVVVFFYFFYDSIADSTVLPSWMSWLKDPTIQGALIGVLIFLIIITFVFKDPKNK